jgi:hypothetical protein
MLLADIVSDGENTCLRIGVAHFSLKISASE